MNYSLPNFQKNQVFRILVDNNLDPGEFNWTDNDEGLFGVQPSFDQPTPMLLHSKTRYYFRFGMLRNSHRSEYSPGSDRLVAASYPGTWEGQLKDLKNWAENLKRELDEPDLWGRVGLWLSTYQMRREPSADAPDEPFASDVLPAVLACLKNIETEICEIRSFQALEQAYIHEKFEELALNATSQSKTSWMQTLIGVMFSLSGQLNFSLQQTYINLTSAMQTLQSYLPSVIRQIPQ